MCRSDCTTRGYPANQALNRIIFLSVIIVTSFIVLFKFYGGAPVEYYHNLAGDPAGPVPIIKEPDNHKPQPGYFKAQPEWNFKVPPRAKGWEGYARKPKSSDVVVLTASDGGGHNSVIPNILERVLEDRQKYCDKHGYVNMWLNTSRYDIGEAHRVSLLLAHSNLRQIC